MEVETKHASLDTLSVTIQALHVNGKQMTLAVFRQLPRGFETEASALWGTVRYPIKDEGDLWLVFSEEGKLYRRALNINPPSATQESNIALRELIQEQEKLNPHRLDYLEELESYQATIRSVQDEIEQELEDDKERYKMDFAFSQLPQLFIAV